MSAQEWIIFIVDRLSGINWAAWVFPAFVVVVVRYMLKVDADPSNHFKVRHFWTDPGGQGNTGPVCYFGSFLFAIFIAWYAAVEKEWTHAVSLSGAALTVFAGVGAWRQSIGAKERIAQINKDKPESVTMPAEVEVTASATSRGRE